MRRGLALAWIGLALAASPVMAKRIGPPLRGVVEGYYGRPWSGDARRDVIRFMGSHGLNAFVYGPKNDPYHRDRWRDPYPQGALADLRETVRVARRSKVRFVFALSPALDVCYACRDDFVALRTKFAAVARTGVRHFALFFDDAPTELSHPPDVKRYAGMDAAALARAHADLCNRTDRWLRRRGLPGLVLMVPTDYAGTECHPYHTELGRRLARGIAVGWTGSGVFAPTLGGDEARARRACVGGHPVVLWDNFPVNDGILSSNLHLGPLTGRDASLARALHGHLLNPMTQPHASLVALGTAAAYFADPAAYDPERAWDDAIGELDPAPDGGGLHVLAEQVRSSTLDLDDARALAAATARVASTYAGATWQPSLDSLATEIARQGAAPPRIATALGGTALGDEIAPWAAELAAHAAREADAVRLLRAMKPAIADLVVTVAGGMLHVTGRALPPDAATVAALGPGLATAPPAPAFGDLLACLGNVLGADIHFCPELGLNVHGKALYVVPYDLTHIETITGRNVHDNFLAFIAARHADFVARQGPGSDALALVLGSTPVPLASDGGFDVTVPVPAATGVALVATTAAGDATAVGVY
jgi:hyaluronoglucosaminidase